MTNTWRCEAPNTTCPICYGSGFVHPVRGGKVDYSTAVYCACRETKVGESPTPSLDAEITAMYPTLGVGDYDVPFEARCNHKRDAKIPIPFIEQEGYKDTDTEDKAPILAAQGQALGVSKAELDAKLEEMIAPICKRLREIKSEAVKPVPATPTKPKFQGGWQ